MNLGVELMGGRRRRRQQAAMQEQSFEAPIQQPVEYQQPEMMGAFSRIKKKMKNLDPKVKKQIAALMASPLPPITKRLLIARLIKRNKPMNLKKILKGMAIAASFGAGAGVATAIVAKRAIARRKAHKALEAANAPETRAETPKNATNPVSNVTGTQQANSGSISSSQTGNNEDSNQEEEGEEGEPPTTSEANTVSTVAADAKKKNIILIGAIVVGAAGLFLLTKKKK